MEEINSREALLEAFQREEKLIVVEKGAVARVMVRFLQREGFNDRILRIVARVSNEKEILGKPCRNIKEEQCEPGAAYLVVKLHEGKHEKVVSFLREQGIHHILLVDYEVYAAISAEENPHLDFLCVGFTKCGTTSLSNAFRQNKKIKLPKGKETFYMHWRNKYDDAPARFREKYFSKETKAALLGDIEPSYHESARDVYECFGGDVKLIFMVRNPVGATFSYYKMMMRRPRRIRYVNYYKKYGKYSIDIFSDYIDDCILSEKIDRFQYDKWIEQYLQYFSRDQIMIVVFEELISDTGRVMSEIQDFIGVKNKIVYESLPHSNEGSGVSANYLGAYINYRFYHSIRNRKENTELSLKKKLFYDNAKKLQKYTVIENDEKMREDQRDTLLDFYRPSVERLESLMGRSLREIWKGF